MCVSDIPYVWKIKICHSNRFYYEKVVCLMVLCFNKLIVLYIAYFLVCEIGLICLDRLDGYFFKFRQAVLVRYTSYNSVHNLGMCMLQNILYIIGVTLPVLTKNGTSWSKSKLVE